MKDPASSARVALAKAKAKTRRLPLTEPASQQTKAFESAAAKIEVSIAELAEGGDDAEAMAIARAIDKLSDRANRPEIRGRGDLDLFWARIKELRDARIKASEDAYKARQEARYAEIARLRQAARDAQPIPGSYEHELAVMRRGLR
jgi:hypothetical protein